MGRLLQDLRIFVAVGFLTAGWLIVLELKRKEKQGLLNYEIVEKKEKGVTKKVAVYPHQRATDIIVIAAVSSMIGAKIFNAFETWESFIADPIDNLFSRSGLTFYGGLIAATVVLYFYCRKHRIPFVHLADVTAPALMLSYGIGRLGCHFSGDGDWGIFNSAYVTNLSSGVLQVAGPGEYGNKLQAVSFYFINNF